MAPPEDRFEFDGFGTDPLEPPRRPHWGDAPKINILVVDDNADYLFALEEVLAGPDRHVVMVQSGDQALRYLLGAEVGVILLDIQLAGLSGYETAALIRKRSRTRTVPIIFVTGCNTDSTDIARGYSLGAVDYIFKPVAPAVLRSKVDCFVELAKSTQILKRQTQALESSEKELINSRAAAMLVKETPLPAILADSRGSLLHANIEAIRILGAHIGQSPAGANWMTLTPGERWLLSAAVREAAERGVTRELCVHPRLQSGELMAVAVSLGPLRDDDGLVLGVLGIGRDMQPYQQAMLDLERTQVELAGKAQELGHLREIVVERDLAIFRLRKENESLRRGLRGSLHLQAEPDACEGETHEDRL